MNPNDNSQQPQTPAQPAGGPAPAGLPQAPQYNPSQSASMAASGTAGASQEENPDKNYLIALVLAYLFGSFGIDRFYLGKTGTAILKLLTLGGLGIWQVIDFLLIAFNKLHAKDDDRPLEGYAKNRSWVKTVAIVLIIVTVLFVIGTIALIIFSAAAGIDGGSGLDSTSPYDYQLDSDIQ